ncbi:unnamed protein product, partial [Iphiclides podalirius]
MENEIMCRNIRKVANTVRYCLYFAIFGFTDNFLSKTGEAESITSHYLFALGSYRGLYLLNWIYRYIAEDHYELIAIVAGVIQTVLYCDFFYLYITKVLKGKKLQLPA